MQYLIYFRITGLFFPFCLLAVISETPPLQIVSKPIACEGALDCGSVWFLCFCSDRNFLHANVFPM